MIPRPARLFAFPGRKDVQSPAAGEPDGGMKNEEQ
jgi:hypothetical protein